MKMDRLTNAARSAAFTGGLSICRTIATFAVRTALLYALGVEYLGLNGLFASVLQVLNIADLGVESAISFSLYRPIAEDDETAICALMRLYRTCYTGIGLFILAAGVCLMPLIPSLIRGNIPAGVNVYFAFLLYLLSASSSYLASGYRKCLLKAHMRGDILSRISLAVLTAVTALQLAAVLILRNYYLYLCLLIVSIVSENRIAAACTKRMYPLYRPEGKLPAEAVRQFRQRIRDLFTAKVSTVILNSADAIVISAFLGLGVLAEYQNYYYILAAVTAFMEVIFDSAIAGIGNSLITESQEKNYCDLRMLTFGVAWAAGWCACCFLCLYQPFMTLWVGEGLLLPFGMVILFVCCFSAIELNRVVNVYKDAAGMWHEDRFRPLTAAVLNLALNLLTVRRLGLYGVLGSSVAATLGVEVPWLLHSLFQKQFPHTCLWSYVRRLLGYGAAVLLACALSYGVCSRIPFGGFAGLACRAAVCALVPNLAFLVLYHRKEELHNWIGMGKTMIGKAAGRQK